VAAPIAVSKKKKISKQTQYAQPLDVVLPAERMPAPDSWGTDTSADFQLGEPL